MRKVLLACGIFSSLLYVTTVVVAGLRWEGYSAASQTVSELFAIGAPTSSLVVPIFVAYALLVYAFGAGVWLSAGRSRALRAAAALIIGKEVLGLIVTLFFPMHLRGTATTLTDQMHAILTLIGVVCMLAAIGFAAAAFGRRFRIYSIATIVLLVVFGVLAGLDGARLEANLPTPWMGVTERINIFAYMLWAIVLAVALLRRAGKQPNGIGAE